MNKKSKQSSKEEKIESIKLLASIDQAIAHWEQEVPLEIQELNKRVFVVHTMVESSLSVRILSCLFENILPSSADYKKLTEADFTKWANIIGGIAESTSSMRFYQRLQYANKLGALEPPEYEELIRFNKLRNKLAHPKSVKGIDYLDALELTYHAAIIVARADFAWFDRIDEIVSESISIDDDNKE